MNALTLHTINDEALVLDIDLATRLGYSIPRKIRQHLIEANREELESFGDLRTELVQTGGRPANAYYLNEEQALLVCMFSKTEKAAAVRKQVISTFMAYRRGQLVVAQQPQLPGNYVEALKALVASEEAKQAAEARAKELAGPAAIGIIVAEQKMSLQRLLTFLPGVNTQQVGNKLRSMNVMRQVDGADKLYAKFKGSHFRHAKVLVGGKPRQRLMVEPKGKEMIVQLYLTGQLQMLKGHDHEWQEHAAASIYAAIDAA